jgi:hypothetical protein
MTTTPETIARLRRLHAESETMAGAHEYRSAACHELPGLLSDLEASQKRELELREALNLAADELTRLIERGNDASRSTLSAVCSALAAKEAK